MLYVGVQKEPGFNVVEVSLQGTCLQLHFCVLFSVIELAITASPALVSANWLLRMTEIQRPIPSNCLSPISKSKDAKRSTVNRWRLYIFVLRFYQFRPVYLKEPLNRQFPVQLITVFRRNQRYMA
jgi:hypothetical protein